MLKSGIALSRLLERFMATDMIQNTDIAAVEYIAKISGVDVYLRWATATSYMECMRLYDLIMGAFFKSEYDGTPHEVSMELGAMASVMLHKAGNYLKPVDRGDDLYGCVHTMVSYDPAN